MDGAQSFDITQSADPGVEAGGRLSNALSRLMVFADAGASQIGE